MSIIVNIIPTFLLFIGAYLVLRHIEKLRSERDTDELAMKVALKLAQIFTEAQASDPILADRITSPTLEFSDLEMKVHREFDVTKKTFDNKSDPQKLIIKFANRGNNIITIKKITYSDSGLGLPKAALSTAYRLDNGHDILIPVNQRKSEVAPEEEYIVELCLAQKWEGDTIDSWKGKWGYLHFDLVYADQAINLQCSI